MFDFPSSPTENQVYNAPGGPQYIFRSPAWRVNQSTSLAVARRNRIVNGAMQISQENGATAGTANSYYGADQWLTIFGGTPTLTTQRVAGYTPNGSVYRYRVTVTAADASLAAGDLFVIRQVIEGARISDFRYGSALARQSILRFGFKAPAGTYSFRIMNALTDRTYVANFTISAGQANTETEQTFVIPGNTTGSWNTDALIGFYFDICLACGTTYQAPAVGWNTGNFTGTSSNTNGMATAGNVFELFDVGLYLDADNSGVAPKWETPDEAQELAACRRYWTFATMNTRAQASAGGHVFASTVAFPAQMRVTPATTAASAPTRVNVTTVALTPSDGMYARGEIIAAAAGDSYALNDVWKLNARM